MSVHSRIALVALPALLSFAAPTSVAPLAAAPLAQGETFDRWELETTYDTLKAVSVPDPARPGASRSLWYLTLKITNKSGAARPLNLGAKMLTTIKNQAPVMPVIAPELKEILKARHPGKEFKNVLEATGTLADKESLDLVVVFGQRAVGDEKGEGIPPEADKLTLRLSGFCASVFRVGASTWKEVRELSINFHRMGDEYQVTINPVRKLGHEWVTISKTQMPGR